MPRRTFNVRNVHVPLAMCLVAGAAFAWYFLIWVPSQKRYFNNRDLRLLSIMGAQIEAKMENLDSVLDNASQSGKSPQELAAFFDNQDLEYLGPSEGDDEYSDCLTEDGSLVPFDPSVNKHKWDKCYKLDVGWELIAGAGDPPRIMLKRDEGKNFAYLAFKTACGSTWQCKPDSQLHSAAVRSMLSGRQHSIMETPVSNCSLQEG